MLNVDVVTDRTFKDYVINSTLPVLVDFWASWCPPCKMMEPTINDLAHVLNGTIRLVKINVDQNPINGLNYKITGVPTFIIFKDGKEVVRRIGAQSKQQLLDMLKQAGINNLVGAE